MLSRIYCLNHFACLNYIYYNYISNGCRYTKFTVLFVTNKSLTKFYKRKNVEINYCRNNKL